MARKLILSVFAIGLLLSLNSCGEYYEVVKQEKVQPKYEMAVELYNKGLKEDSDKAFRRTITLLEDILPQFRGKPAGQKIAFMYANSYYKLESYYDSGYQFERFRKAYPKSDKVEEAYFKEAKSYYFASPRYSLDQTDTKKAIKKLQTYITKFPSGEHIGDANELLGELQEKLAKKQFEIAELYYGMEDYKAAIAAMDNFIGNFPGSKYQEKAYYLKLKSAYILAVNSYRTLVEKRLKEAREYYKDYSKYFPEGKYKQEADELNEKIEKHLNNFI